MSLVVLFSPFNVCFLLLTMCVHSPAMCASHSDSLVGYYTWSTLLIIVNASMSLANLWQMTTLLS
jgi:hypothetical protein